MLLALIEDGWHGLDLILGDEPSRPSIPPFTAEQARRWADDPRAWAVWFREQLRAASTSPLHTGDWRVTGTHDPQGSALLPPGWRLVDWVGGTAHHDFGTRETPLIPLRPLSPQDAGRVRAHRRLCREGALAPVLVWEVSGIAGFVIIDGHDRVVAALTEGRPVPFLVLQRHDHERVAERWQRVQLPAFRSALEHADEAERQGAPPSLAESFRRQAGSHLVDDVDASTPSAAWSLTPEQWSALMRRARR